MEQLVKMYVDREQRRSVKEVQRRLTVLGVSYEVDVQDGVERIVEKLAGVTEPALGIVARNSPLFSAMPGFCYGGRLYGHLVFGNRSGINYLSLYAERLRKDCQESSARWWGRANHRAGLL